MTIAGNKLLPGKKIIFNAKSSTEYKDYSYDFIIPENSNLIGLEIKNGRLKELNSLFVRSIEREGKIIETKKGTFSLLANDKLHVAGKSDQVELHSWPTIMLNLNGIDLVKNLPKNELKQYEAVISPRFPGVGKTIP